MSNDYLFLLKSIAWVPTSFLCMLYASATGSPGLAWFWGIGLVVDLIILGFAIAGVAK